MRPSFITAISWRQRQRLALVVGHVDGGEAELALQPLELEAHALAQLGVEIGQRLVEQQELRLHHERARQRQALLLAAGELGRLALGQMVERDRGEHAHHLVADLAAWRSPAHLQREGDVLEHVHVRPDRVGLEHHAEVALVGRHEHALARTNRRRGRRPDLAAVGFSRPAIERSVVVLPQPEGPSSVKSLPSGTSK